MASSELHIQPVLWDHRGARFAVLFLESEAPDRSDGGAILDDALFRVVLARGLRLTTDLDHLVLAPTPDWQAHIDQAGMVTLRWPHHTPLLADAPLDLPEGWIRSAFDRGLVLVFASYVSVCTSTDNGPAHPVEHLPYVAENGALAAGVVPFTLRGQTVNDHG